MKKTRFSEEQMVKILREADEALVAEVAKKHGFTQISTFPVLPFPPMRSMGWKILLGSATQDYWPSVWSGSEITYRARTAAQTDGPYAVPDTYS